MIESLIISGLLILILIGFMTILYQMVVLSWSDWAIHESLICTNSNSISLCEVKLIKQLRKILFFNERLKVSIYNFGIKTLRAEAHITFTIYANTIIIKQQYGP